MFIISPSHAPHSVIVHTVPNTITPQLSPLQPNTSHFHHTPTGCNPGFFPRLRSLQVLSESHAERRSHGPVHLDLYHGLGGLGAAGLGGRGARLGGLVVGRDGGGVEVVDLDGLGADDVLEGGGGGSHSFIVREEVEVSTEKPRSM